MQLKRRHFLQFGGSALAGIGLSQWDIMQQGNQYAKVLAQGRPGRKLALLVGVNAYPSGIRSLRGCLTDVELQYELLVHRYGFNPKDILIVSDAAALKPTRQNILQAFETHLIKQAKSDDVVVFHFSGHGSLVLDPSSNPLYKSEDGKPINGTMVPGDSTISSNSETVNDIMGRSLFLLMSALKTDHVTVVLDSCHSGGGTRGNLQIRSVPSRLSSDALARPNEEELEFQKRWMKTLNLTEADLNRMRQKGIAKGVAIGSAQYSQFAADAPFSGFYAGAFTYLLTRYLWQQSLNQSVETVFNNLALITKDLANKSAIIQEPIFFANPQTQAAKPIYFQTPVLPAAEAVVRKLDGEQVEFWLGGVSSQELDVYREGSVFVAIDPKGKELAKITQTARRGLVGYGKVTAGKANPVKLGTLLREEIRGIPTDLKLRLALDPSLKDAAPTIQTALQSFARVELVKLGRGAEVDYILGRFTDDYERQFQQAKLPNLPPLNSIGLFTASLQPLPTSFDLADESPTDALDRLRPRLKSLLAARILQLTGSGAHSGLKVKAEIGPVNSKIRSAIGSRGAKEAQLIPQALSNHPPKFKVNTQMQIKVTNHEKRSLYLSVIVIDSDGNLVILYPATWDQPESAALIPAGKSLAVPRPEDDLKFEIAGPAGHFELLLLTSTKPLRNALRGLQNIARSRKIRTAQYIDLQADEPEELVASLLGDLDEQSRSARGRLVAKSSRIAQLDSEQIAAFSMVIEVTES